MRNVVEELRPEGGAKEEDDAYLDATVDGELPDVMGDDVAAAGAAEPAVSTLQGRTRSERAPSAGGTGVPVVDSTALAAAFRGVKVERTLHGGLRVEAEGESAALLAGVFAGVAALFGGVV